MDAVTTGDDAPAASPPDIEPPATEPGGDPVALMRRCVDAGWIWEDATATLSHPADPAAFFRIDPQSRRVTLSPKLAASLGGLDEPPPPEVQP